MPGAPPSSNRPGWDDAVVSKSPTSPHLSLLWQPVTAVKCAPKHGDTVWPSLHFDVEPGAARRRSWSDLRAGSERLRSQALWSWNTLARPP